MQTDGYSHGKIEMNIKNMLIDGSFPLLFWGAVYLGAVVVGYWTMPQYKSWFFLMAAMSPINCISGRLVNRWRKWNKYNYKGYE